VSFAPENEPPALPWVSLMMKKDKRLRKFLSRYLRPTSQTQILPDPALPSF
jgi:hypothetical protein